MGFSRPTIGVIIQPPFGALHAVTYCGDVVACLYGGPQMADDSTEAVGLLLEMESLCSFYGVENCVV